MARLLRDEPDAVAVSARTGAGMAELMDRVAALLPRPQVDLEVMLPFARGDLVNRVHAEGEVLGQEHTPEGTRLRARVRPALAGELAPFTR